MTIINKLPLNPLKIFKGFAVFLILQIAAPATAQEVLENIKVNKNLKQVIHHHGILSKTGAAVHDTLPFIDDFSYNSPFPDPAKWLDKKVFINTTYPIKPPTIGVATFDALDENGEPYARNANLSGPADTLTSQPLKLGGYSAANNIYLSFFYQAQGLGNMPEFHDSLILEFKSANGWESVWKATSTGAPVNNFRMVILPVTESRFLYDGFQFRFRNYATLSGNNDHWHLDYVKMDKDRSPADTILNDVAFTMPGYSLLKNYNAMPLSHFKGFEQAELADFIYVNARNSFNIIKNTTFTYQATEDCNGATFSSGNFQTINFPGLSDTTLSRANFVNDITTLMNNISCDSLVITTRYQLINSPPDFATPFNDFTLHHQQFHNYFAYDDGTAEKAYGITGRGGQVAVEFFANKPDTLRAIQIHFAHVDKDISNTLFNIRIWDNLDVPGGANDQIIYQQDFQLLEYVDSLNGFYTYLLDEPVLVSGKFFIGWHQEHDENLRIGFDMNNNRRNRLFFNVSNNWQNTIFEGALMMRPVVGSALPTTIKTPPLISKNVKIFPNPASDVIHLDISGMEDMEIFITDNLGRIVIKEKISGRSINIDNLPQGLYLVQVSDNAKNIVYSGKFVKAR